MYRFSSNFDAIFGRNYVFSPLTEIRIFREIRSKFRRNFIPWSSVGGFELLPPPPPSYYDGVRRLAGDVLSEEQIKECQEMGVSVDRDDHGRVVLQVFTKAAVDR